ncbi:MULTISPECIES: exodeoxyribonuclease III [unclassified Campylobacter]|uniref:exodeoxyribonuclease III n=1 Tax=unclassified Campylobacter TaxID=2593542 RepID=UPI001237ECF9|nr:MULTISPECIES: exodeoxyribonuclease III [unclassified Campylobacter]KAA6227001.1 exodeoxyribonuclease III [Campylobacter sp. LR185c]KAA6228156.1 exodeoxyribonuclease III [Campylobacter sp. LR286c]KAA6229978.1 exodeoxyribonuclease III [Campylobacter sp. LR291e]KAA8603178.1 exodeoxyribonuclease III [Campylobacter sp. LR185c]
MKLLSWNVNGLRAICGKGGLDFLENEKFDFVGFQEIKASEDNFPKKIYELPFKQMFSNSAKRLGYSGVMSLCNFENTTKKCEFFNDDEGRVLEHNFKDFTLFNIYFPNGQKDEIRLAYKMDFYKDFLAYLKKLLKENRQIIICGDVNTAHKEIDLTHPKANANTSGFLPIERAWIDDLLKLGFIDTFRQIHGDIKDKYSWWSYRMRAREKNVGWRIDYFFISKGLKDKLKDAYIRTDIMGSDHAPVGIELDI